MTRFQDDLISFLRGQPKVLDAIRDSGDLGDETLNALKAAVETFAGGFVVDDEQAA